MNHEELSLRGAAAEIRARALSPVEYTEAIFRVLDRAESRVQASVTIDRESVLSEARKCDAEARSGSFRGVIVAFTERP